MTETDTSIIVPPSPDTVRWLQDSEALDTWLDSLDVDVPLALDTEFERVSTFYPIPGLLQLGGNGEFWLVEPEVAQASDR
ncbi:MAG: ribonuclease D, partial [Marinobacter sp.]